ncbi:MAG: 16S rRNA (uracil(1498)-N(3))-methyltransferase [Legionellaceae bacterium]|nr:16S rRNA (uracil(1498)-N(3))-methyltransferase [Legionellaceae bacterium]
MRTIRIYQPGNYQPGQTLDLSPSASQHVGVVLRLHPGDVIILFDGENHECLATILTVQKKQVTLRIDTINTVSRESPRAIHLAQGISKGDRMEWVIQKAVELGVNSITPLLTARCVVKLDNDRMAKKQLQWQAIAVAACEQCGRNQIPIIHQTQSFISYIQHCQPSNKWVLYPDAEKSWRNYSSILGDIALLIGPEGGLNDDEINLAFNHQFQPLSLGPRILRTETAAITAMSVLQAIFGDM